MSLDHPEETAPLKAYLIRAVWQCCADFGYTPYLQVVVDDYTEVPENYVQNGEIVLNLSASACAQLNLADDFITCKARFAGRPFEISVPVGRVRAIFARENVEIALHFAVEETPNPKNSPDSSLPSGIRLVD